MEGEQGERGQRQGAAAVEVVAAAGTEVNPERERMKGSALRRVGRKGGCGEEDRREVVL